ncbi:PfkB family carbohydrate kinase [Pseudomonas sp.]|uniref:bifunctional heptose 7-phosphate kinase/heptose 1-phosphate adenyltransferase n=1 Tax=Pseudomonas sp. TaxID=306 RepID=UPI00258FAEFD|nr:PfkB family carbohydrate kinase [Pseudomonas sp.]
MDIVIPSRLLAAEDYLGPAPEKLDQVRMLVVGDVMLDRYWFGDVSRISPEAPVPVVRIERREERLGGAANVARNAAALGAHSGLLGVVGNDEAGDSVEQILRESSIDSYLKRDSAISTIIKLRVIGRQQQMVRIDFEDAPTETVLRDKLAQTESVEICPGGKLLYTVKKEGVVRQFDESGKDPVYVDGITNPTFILCDKRGLWIVEDQTHLARLWLRTPDGKLQVILSHLRAPQELLPTGDNTYLLAEGGRNRVIELKAD